MPTLVHYRDGHVHNSCFQLIDNFDVSRLCCKGVHIQSYCKLQISVKQLAIIHRFKGMSSE